jgi:hypothetical protein
MPEWSWIGSSGRLNEESPRGDPRLRGPDDSGIRADRSIPPSDRSIRIHPDDPPDPPPDPPPVGPGDGAPPVMARSWSSLSLMGCGCFFSSSFFALLWSRDLSAMLDSASKRLDGCSLSGSRRSIPDVIRPSGFSQVRPVAATAPRDRPGKPGCTPPRNPGGSCGRPDRIDFGEFEFSEEIRVRSGRLAVSWARRCKSHPS